MTNSTISGNISHATYGRGGAGIYNAGFLTVTNSIISGNGPAYSGGGMYLASSNPTVINNSTISGNTAYVSGGGIYNVGTDLVVNNSTISGNTATNYRGGGLHNHSSAYAKLFNTTVSGNTAYFGGGLFNYAGTLGVYSSTITVNMATHYGGVGNISDLTMKHSIVSGNTASTAVNEMYDATGGAGLNAYNLFGHAGETNGDAFLGFTPSGSDINATSDGAGVPLTNILDPNLADNGGPTLTHALLPGPAVDAIPSGSLRSAASTPILCTPGTSYDQRGVFRANIGGPGICDIGAFEYGAAPTAVTIAGFSAETAWGSGPQLAWETANESALSGFHIWRGSADKAETRLTDELIGASGGLNGREYTWQDSASFGWGQRTYYWLEAVNADGGSAFTGPVEVLGIGRLFLPRVGR